MNEVLVSSARDRDKGSIRPPADSVSSPVDKSEDEADARRSSVVEVVASHPDPSCQGHDDIKRTPGKSLPLTPGTSLPLTTGTSLPLTPGTSSAALTAATPIAGVPQSLVLADREDDVYFRPIGRSPTAFLPRHDGVAEEDAYRPVLACPFASSHDFAREGIQLEGTPLTPLPELPELQPIESFEEEGRDAAESMEVAESTSKG